LAADDQLTPEYVRRAAKILLPQSMTDDDNAFRAWAILAGESRRAPVSLRGVEEVHVAGT
jgi:hypothetical protein